MANQSPALAGALVTRNELAQALRISTRTVSRRVQAGKIPVLRTGRKMLFDLEAVKAKLAQPDAEPPQALEPC